VNLRNEAASGVGNVIRRLSDRLQLLIAVPRDEMSAARLSRTNAKSSRVAHTGARWVACDGSSVMLIWWRGNARRDEREYPNAIMCTQAGSGTFLSSSTMPSDATGAAPA
jgi:hypothetical protein